jgi:hypothetical protein
MGAGLGAKKSLCLNDELLDLMDFEGVMEGDGVVDRLTC